MTAPVPTVTDEQPSDAPAPSAPALPDRADAPVTEVAERFLRAVVAQVPLALIEELHLFSPLRQGTVETGIAVLAAKVPLPVEPVDVQPEDAAGTGAPELPFEGESEEGAEAGEAEAGEVEAGEAEAGEVEAGEAEAGEAEAGEAEAVTAGMGETAHLTAHAAEVIAAEGDDDEDVSYAGELESVASADEGDEAAAIEEAVDIVEALPARPVRHTVYTARYRYVIKGPERGKWESSIKAEADAPLITVETVVRGVQRRAGEESEIVRYTAAQIARALRMPFPA